MRALADEAYKILDDANGEAAELCALQVLVNAPDDPESYLLMAEVAEENADFEQALMWINRGLHHFADHFGLMLKKAAILLDGFDDVDEAFILLTKLRASFDGHAPSLTKDVDPSLVLEVYLMLADCYRLRSDYAEALACAMSASKIAPTDDNAVLALATARFEMGDYDHAHEMLLPLLSREDAPDCHWQHAQILCAQGQFVEADDAFLRAHKMDKSRYHRPVRLSPSDFAHTVMQAFASLPREIRNFVQKASVNIADVVPQDFVKKSHGHISPLSCINIDMDTKNNSDHAPIIFLYQKNIENLASKKVEIKDLIASALLHDLGKLAVNN